MVNEPDEEYEEIEEPKGNGADHNGCVCLEEDPYLCLAMLAEMSFEESVQQGGCECMCHPDNLPEDYIYHDGA